MQDSDCNGTCAGLPRCVTPSCVQCINVSDCPPSNLCVMYMCINYACQSAVKACSIEPQFCDINYGCVNCNASQGCNTSFPYCNTTSPPNYCGNCLSTQNCTNGSYCNISTNMCESPPSNNTSSKISASKISASKSSASKPKDSITATSQSHKPTNLNDPKIPIIIVAASVVAASSAGVIYCFISKKKKANKNAIPISLHQATAFNINSVPPTQIAVETIVKTTVTNTTTTGLNL